MSFWDLPYDIKSIFNVIDLEKLKVFKFAIEIEGSFPGIKFYAGFNSIKGISSAVDVREVQEGGFRGKHSFPRRVQMMPLTIVRGMTFSRDLWNWHQEVINWTRGKGDYRRNMSIYILDSIFPFGEEVAFEVWRFDVFDAWPSQWDGPELDSMKEEIAFESIVIQHKGISEARSIIGDQTAEVISLLQ